MNLSRWPMLRFFTKNLFQSPKLSFKHFSGHLETETMGKVLLVYPSFVPWKSCEKFLRLGLGRKKNYYHKIDFFCLRSLVEGYVRVGGELSWTFP